MGWVQNRSYLNNTVIAIYMQMMVGICFQNIHDSYFPKRMEQYNHNTTSSTQRPPRRTRRWLVCPLHPSAADGQKENGVSSIFQEERGHRFALSAFPRSGIAVLLDFLLNTNSTVHQIEIFFRSTPFAVPDHLWIPIVEKTPDALKRRRVWKWEYEFRSASDGVQMIWHTRKFKRRFEKTSFKEQNRFENEKSAKTPTVTRSKPMTLRTSSAQEPRPPPPYDRSPKTATVREEVRVGQDYRWHYCFPHIKK